MIEHIKDVFVTELVTIFCVLMWHGTWTLVDAFYESLMRWEDSVWYSLVSRHFNCYPLRVRVRHISGLYEGLDCPSDWFRGVAEEGATPTNQ